jgi:ribosomal protein S27E
MIRCKHCGAAIEPDFQDKVMVHGEMMDLFRNMQCKQCRTVNVVVYHAGSIVESYYNKD